jgi:hypothetical protein
VDDYAAQLIGVFILEFGIIFHSILYGMEDNPKFQNKNPNKLGCIVIHERKVASSYLCDSYFGTSQQSDMVDDGGRCLGGVDNFGGRNQAKRHLPMDDLCSRLKLSSIGR